MNDITNFFGFPVKTKLNIDKNDLILASKDGVIGAITGFYLGDIIKNILIDQKKNIFDIINIRSQISDYMATCSAGFLGGITSLYLDPIANNIFSTSITSYSKNEYAKLTNEEIISNLELSYGIIFDSIVTSIIFAFIYKGNIHVPLRHHNDYLNTKILFTDDAFSFEFQSQFLTAILINLYYIFREVSSNN